MQIVLNRRLFRSARIGGMENVVRRLAAELAAEPLAGDQRVAILARDDEPAAGLYPGARIDTVAPGAPDRAWRRAAARRRPDLLLCPLLALDPPDLDCPSAVWVPDLQHETYPEFFDAETLAWRRRTFAETFARAGLIVTLSEYSRRTMLARYPATPPERIVVQPPRVDEAFREPASSETACRADRLDLPPRYLYYPANYWPHKNHRKLIEALVRLESRGLRPPLVLTGDPGSGAERVESAVAEAGLGGHVRLLGYVPREVGAEIMRRAAAVVFPSLYEGFGLPLAEAFHAETPLVASTAGSCPEVVGDAALTFDPASPSELAEAIERVWTDASLAARLVARGRVRRVELDARAGFAPLRERLRDLASVRAEVPAVSRWSAALRAVGLAG